jgi:membrane protease YdiL (CAAX protease family)
VWALWHLPLFWIVGTYHYGLRELGIGYMLNFLISVSPLGFLTTWVYVKNNRSMLACIIFHLFVNTMQEKIAMTPQTKCVETIVVFVAAALVVCTNREMFFEKEHIGKIINQ